MDFFFELVAEVAVQIVGNAIVDCLGIRRTKVTSAVWSVLLASLLGVALAGIAIAVHPEPIIREPSLRIAALVVLPLLNGLLLAFVGRQIAARGKVRSGFEYFLPAFAFSLVFGITRFAATPQTA